MGFLELFILAIGLSMDAFAVSVCKGLAMPKCTIKNASICGLWFGGFQAGMPLIGYLVGYNFRDYITKFDHWIAFGLLTVLGIRMIKEGVGNDDDKHSFNPSQLKVILTLAVATSIDALAVGISFACTGMDTFASIFSPIVIIGFVSFVLSVIGQMLGVYFGKRINLRSELLGGIILIVIGIKILMEHLQLI